MNLDIKRNAFALVTSVALASACASGPKPVDFSAGTEPGAKVLEVRSRMNDDEAKQYDQLSPSHFRKASNALTEAQKRIEGRKSGEEILAKAGEASAELEIVEQNATKNASVMAPAIAARKAAVDAKSKVTVSGDLASADKKLQSFGRDIESGDFRPDPKEISELEARYSQLELRSVKIATLGETKAIIDRAREQDAEDKAPQTLSAAQVSYDSALRSIAVNRREPSAYQPAVTESITSARKLDQVMNTIGNSKTTEAAAVQIYNQKQQLAASQATIDQANAQAQATAGQLSAEQARGAELKGENEKYADKAALESKIAAVKAEFSPSEAEVLRDGSKIVLRLKNMKFSSARFELTEASINTLQKVKNMIAAVPVAKVMIEGHTDSVGGEAKNRTLSEKRADTVKKYLVAENSVPAEKVESQGFGYERPLATNKTAEGRATNRRVDVVIEPAQQ